MPEDILERDIVVTRILLGTSYDDIRSRALEAAADVGSGAVSSVLWLENNDHLADQLADQWAADQFPLSMRIANLDDLVGDAFDDQRGPASRLDALDRRQIVEQALRTHTVDSLLADAHRFRGEVIELLSALESEGCDTRDALSELVDASDIPTTAAEFLRQTQRAVDESMGTVVTDAEYSNRAAYRAVTTGDVSLRPILDGVDVVVLSNYYELSAQQRAVIDQLADEVPLIVSLPVVSGSITDLETGADALTADAVSFYTSLVSDADMVRWVDSDEDDVLETVATSLYRATADTVSVDPDTLRWIEAPTPDREVRAVAQSIRRRIARDPAVTQDNTMVVVPGLVTYRERIEDEFETVGLTPVSITNKLLYQTYAGRAMLDLVALCNESDPNPVLLGKIASNPLVEIEADGAEVTRLARALPTTDVDRLLEELEDPHASALRELRSRANDVASETGPDVVEAVRELFAHVALEECLEQLEEPFDTHFERQMEQRAYRRVTRSLDAIERVVEAHLDADAAAHDGDVLQRIADELDQIRVPPPPQSSEGVLEVAGQREALGRDYDHLYLVGMTERDFPPDPERPRFFESLFDGIADDAVAPTDQRALARYQFATMLASADTVRISTPERTSGDDPLLPSPVLEEIRRVTDIEPESPEGGHATSEDVQRAIGQSTGVDAADGVQQAIDAGVFEGATATRVSHGVACAQHRASPERTAHDGQLTPATADAIYPENARLPYSPTRLTDYAKCGFRFVMKEAVELEEPLEYHIEPTPLDHGNLVHGTLRRFYRRLQSGPGEPVDLGDHDRDVLEERLLTAAEETLDELALSYEGAFFDRWLERLLAGLGTPEKNPYYGSVGDTGAIHADADGLFGRFLTRERNRDRYQAPGWFEVGMDLTEPDHDDRAGMAADDTPSTTAGSAADSTDDSQIDLQTPDGTVPVYGQMDRIAVDRTQSPPEGLVHDYKSSDRSAGLDVDGVRFQLPLYATAASRGLPDDVSTPVDASYYTIATGDFGESWSLSYYLYRQGDGTDEDYRRLIEEETPRRVGAIDTAISGGAFQPTVLEAEEAGCRHCPFSDVCDVRYHMRQDVVEAIDEDDEPGYAPQQARPDSFLDTCGGDDQ